MSDNDPIPYILVDRPPKPGDRVHVEYDATYAHGDYFGAHTVSIDLPDCTDYYHAAAPAGSIKVIVEPVKVGDVITSGEAEKLPAYSAVLCIENGVPYVTRHDKDGLWVGETRMCATGSETCRVLHIGDDQ